MKLNLGCGDRKIHGFINVDVRPECKPDAVIDLHAVSTLYHGKAELVYACHVLEHFPRKDIQKILADWINCLKPGGTLRISVPDFDQIIKMYLIEKDLSKLYGYLYGGQKNKFDFHCTVFNFESIKEILEDLGLVEVRRYDWKLTEHAFVDDYSQAYLPHMDKLNGTLMSLNVEATKPELTA